MQPLSWPPSRNPPASLSQVLALQACAITFGFKPNFQQENQFLKERERFYTNVYIIKEVYIENTLHGKTFDCQKEHSQLAKKQLIYIQIKYSYIKYVHKYNIFIGWMLFIRLHFFPWLCSRQKMLPGLSHQMPTFRGCSAGSTGIPLANISQVSLQRLCKSDLGKSENLMDLSAKFIDPFWNWWQKTELKI